MKATLFPSRRRAGIMLVECVTYLAVFAILTGVATAAFYLCWDHTKALMYATDDISTALRAGEHWRADVRGATGQMTLESLAGSERLHIPTAAGELVYRFENGKVFRDGAAGHSQPVVPLAQKSSMSREVRHGVTAWRWELELKLRRTETQLPLWFTFEAVPSHP
jgi:Tfp pilus assembly protein FimT